MIRYAQVSLCLIAVLAACDDPFSPTVANVSGSYHATTLLVTDSAGVTDYLAIGSSITLQLDAAGTVSGHLLIVGGNEGGGDLEADMVGTWALAGDTVSFDQTADTFVRDWGFKAGERRLTMDHTGGGVTVNLVLTKQS